MALKDTTQGYRINAGPAFNVPPKETSMCNRTRMIECPACRGEGVRTWIGGIDYRSGGYIEYGDRCHYCDGTGEVEIALEPITLDDLDEFSPLENLSDGSYI